MSLMHSGQAQRAAVGLFAGVCLLLASIYGQAADYSQSLPELRFLFSLSGTINQPAAVAIHNTGHIYVLDGTRHRIQVYDASGQPLFAFGRRGRAQGEWLNPMDVQIQGDELIVADTGNQRLSFFSLDGTFKRHLPLTTPAQTGASAPVEVVALKLDDNVVYWSDRRHHRICAQQLDTGKAIRCFGQAGRGRTEFRYPFRMAMDQAGYLHAIDILNGQLQVWHRNGQHRYNIGQFGSQPGQLYRPNGIDFDANQRLYVGDAYLAQISVFYEGRFIGLLDLPGESPRSITDVRWHNQRLYVVDSLSHAVYVYTYTGERAVVTAQHSRNHQSGQDCVMCHLSWDHPAAKAADPTLVGNNAILPVASLAMCYSCHHGAIIDSRQALARGHQHPSLETPSEKQETPSKRTEHIPQQFPTLGDQHLSCASCHTPHHKQKNYEPLNPAHHNAWLRNSNDQFDQCEQCHADKAWGSRKPELKPATQPEQKPVRAINHPLGMTLDAENKPKPLPAGIREHGGNLDSQQQLVCQSCHQIHGGSSTDLLASTTPDSLCQHCHSSQTANTADEARQKGRHPTRLALEEKREFMGKPFTELNCQTCHAVHEGEPQTALLPKGIENAETLCRECHQNQHTDDREDARQRSKHPVGVTLDPPVIMGKESLTQIGCLSCHSVHNGHADTPALREPVQEGQLCQHCHKSALSVINTDHDLRYSSATSVNALNEKAGDVGVCSSCHSMHRAEDKRLALSVIAHPQHPPTANEVHSELASDQLCLSCHRNEGIAKEKSAFRHQHPYQDVILRSDPNVMPLVNDNSETKIFGRIACRTCHNVHQWQPEVLTPPTENTQESSALDLNTRNKPSTRGEEAIEGDSHSSFLRQKGVEGTFCVDCHGPDAVFKYRYYHDKQSHNPAIDYLK